MATCITITLIAVAFSGCGGFGIPDSDGDGYHDEEDIDNNLDVITVFHITKVRVDDDVDSDDTADLYFKISGKPDKWVARSENNRSPTVEIPDDKNIHELNYTFIYNNPDNEPNISFTFSLFDDDPILHDKLDISGIGKGCHIKYNIITGEISGDTNEGITSGNDDDSTNEDENDATVWFEIYSTYGSAGNLSEMLNLTANEIGEIIDSNEDIIDQCYHEAINQVESGFQDELIEQVVNFCKTHPELVPHLAKYAGPIGVAYQIYGVCTLLYSIKMGNNDY